MASVQRYRDTGYRLFVYLGRRSDGTQITRTKVVNTTQDEDGLAVAYAELARFKRTLGVETPEQAGTATLDDLLAEHAELENRNWTPRTVETNAMWRRICVTELNNPLVTNITGRQIARFYNDLQTKGHTTGRRPLAPSSVARCHNVLTVAFRRAVEWGWITTSPMTYVRAPTRTRRRPKPPGPAAVRAALNNCDQPMWHLFLQLAATTGARRGELLGLQWGDVDGPLLHIRRSVGIANRTIHVKPPKTGIERVAVLATTEQTAIDAWRRHQPGTNPDWYIFHPGDPTGPLPPHTVGTWWKKLRRDTPALAGVRFHDVRHYVATQLESAGTPMTTVSKHVGHTLPSTTANIYAHSVRQDRIDAADLVSQLLTDTTPQNA